MTSFLPQKGTPVFCSWSGGKDCCLALYRAIQAGAQPRCLVSMLTEEGQRSRSHGLSNDVLNAQSASLGIPLVTRKTSWEDYESTFISVLKEVRQSGIAAGVFGDIDTEAHREWECRVSAEASMTAFLPLWQADRHALLEEFISSGFRAVVVAAKDPVPGEALLGRTVDAALVDELTRLGIDPCGEYGEYHTVVVNGPIFRKPIEVTPGRRLLRSGYWFLDLLTSPPTPRPRGS